MDEELVRPIALQTAPGLLGRKTISLLDLQLTPTRLRLAQRMAVRATLPALLRCDAGFRHNSVTSTRAHSLDWSGLLAIS